MIPLLTACSGLPLFQEKHYIVTCKIESFLFGVDKFLFKNVLVFIFKETKFKMAFI